MRYGRERLLLTGTPLEEHCLISGIVRVDEVPIFETEQPGSWGSFDSGLGRSLARKRGRPKTASRPFIGVAHGGTR